MAGLQSKVRTCLWFNGRAREAAEFYVSLLPDSRIDQEFGADHGEPMVVEFTLAGAPMMILNGGPMFQPSEAASISVLTDDQEETDRLWAALTADGGQDSMCAWLKDRFGVSWQVVPRRLIELIHHEDAVGAQRAQAAMMKMRKIDIAAIERAFESETGSAT